MKRRGMACVAAVAALLPLAACTVEGEIFVDGPDEFRVDLTVAYPARDTGRWPGPCSTDRQGPLTFTPRRTEAGQRACRIVGAVGPGTITEWQLWRYGMSASSADHLFLQVPRLNLVTEETGAIQELNVTLHFPGDVVAASEAGQVAGDSVHLTDPHLLWTDGLSVTASARPTEPGWLLPAAAGLGWGAALAGAVLWVLRVNRDHDPEATPVRPGVEPGSARLAPSTDPAAASSPGPPEDPSVWAADA